MQITLRDVCFKAAARWAGVSRIYYRLYKAIDCAQIVYFYSHFSKNIPPVKVPAIAHTDTPDVEAGVSAASPPVLFIIAVLERVVVLGTVFTPLLPSSSLGEIVPPDIVILSVR